MQVSQRSIFRDKVVKHYMQGRDNDSLPRFTSWPIPIFLWLLLGVLLTAGAFAWYEKVPTYANASGMVLNNRSLVSHKQDMAVAMVLLPPKMAPQLHVGQGVRVQLGSSGPQVETKITVVEPGIVSPYAIRKRLNLDGRESLFITQPSVIVLINLEGISPTAYVGSTLTARIEVGSQRLLAFLPGLGGLVGR